MTDAEIVEYLAHNVMGWSKGYVRTGWKPLESIDDAVEAQMKVPADKQRAVGVEAARLVKNNTLSGLWSGVSDWDMLCVNARGRCLAILAAFDVIEVPE